MEDERTEELTTIAAIYPELVVDPADPFAASLELPVAPSDPLNVEFPAAPLPSPPSSDDGRKHSLTAVAALRDAHKLQHLPPIRLNITLPDGYPAGLAPKVKLSTTPTWIPEEKLHELEEEVARLWEEYGQCQVLFSYIDYLQQAAERAFDLAPTSNAALTLLPGLKPALLEYDSKTKKEIFNAGTYDCGVCLEPKKGSACYQMRRCGHVFCLSCLQDFYNNCITEGDVVNVRCMDPTCGKDGPSKRKTKKERTLHPKELLDMGIEESAVRRYVEMKRKKKLEADKTTVYCPRTWCQGPARTNKYPPIPADLATYPESDSENESAASVGHVPDNKLPAPADRLSVCSKCSFAFCRICYTGWHGEFARCWPRNPGELSEEEKASYEYIRLNTSPCPTCSSPTQKTMGCNHMKCFQCNTHFCYLCGAWLSPDNPYQHFNKLGTSCYQQLWVLEEGDEGQGANFQGARRWEEEARRVAEEADREEAERLQREEMEEAMVGDERVRGNRVNSA